jgi:heme-degrading monooxygenase HmoA
MAATIAPERHPAIEFDHAEAQEVATTAPVTIILSYQVLPAGVQGWRALWEQVAALARGTKGCRRFRLLHDRQNLSHYAVLTEWDDMHSFDRFYRDSQLAWTERVWADACMSLGCDTFDVL